MRSSMRAMKKYGISLVLMMCVAFALISVRAEAAEVGKVTEVEQTKAQSSGISLEWKALLGNSIYYEVEISQDQRTWVSISDGRTANSVYIPNLSAGSTYYVRVRAYTKTYVSGEWIMNYGDYSDPIECVTAPSGSTAYVRKTNSTTTSMTLQWKSVNGANAYLVEYWKSSSNRNTAKVVKVKDTKTTLKKLAKNTKYNVCVYGVRQTKDGKYASQKEQSAGKTEYRLGVTPSKATGVECSYYWQYVKQIQVNCKKIESADGYQAEVWTANKKKDTKIVSGTAQGTSINLKKSVFGKHSMVKFRVRAYTENYNGTKKYGEWSSWKYVSPQPDVTKIAKKGNGLKVTWDKISGADRYLVYASTQQKSGYKKVATVTKNTYTLTKWNKKALKNGKRYYFYVVAQKKVGGKYYSGEAGNANYCWSKEY